MSSKCSHWESVSQEKDHLRHEAWIKANRERLGDNCKPPAQKVWLNEGELASAGNASDLEGFFGHQGNEPLPESYEEEARETAQAHAERLREERQVEELLPLSQATRDKGKQKEQQQANPGQSEDHQSAGGLGEIFGLYYEQESCTCNSATRIQPHA
ncbi:unnamed protein product [Sympodiomycopsis kandeliae]